MGAFQCVHFSPNGKPMWNFSKLLLLALLSGGQASFVQMYGFFPVEQVLSVGYAPSMFIANTAFALCCLMWGRTLGVVYIVGQCLLSAFLCTYVSVMGTQASLPALIQGFSLVQQMETGILPYVNIKIIGIFTTVACIMLVMLQRIRPLSLPQRTIASLCALSLFCTLHYTNHRVKSYSILSPENTITAMKNGDFSSIRESNARRGYLLTAFIQACTGALDIQPQIAEGGCSPQKAQGMAPASNRQAGGVATDRISGLGSLGPKSRG